MFTGENGLNYIFRTRAAFSMCPLLPLLSKSATPRHGFYFIVNIFKTRSNLSGTYRGVGLIRTTEIAKNPYELAAPYKSKFLTDKKTCYPKFLTVP